MSVTCWRQLAENVHRTFNVGDPIIVRGRLRSRTYEDKEVEPQTVTELEGLAVGPDLSRSVGRRHPAPPRWPPLGLAPREGQNGTERTEPARTAPTGRHDGNGDSLAGDDSAWRAIGSRTTRGGSVTRTPPAVRRTAGSAGTNRGALAEAAVGA